MTPARVDTAPRRIKRTITIGGKGTSTFIVGSVVVVVEIYTLNDEFDIDACASQTRENRASHAGTVRDAHDPDLSQVGISNDATDSDFCHWIALLSQISNI